MRPYEMMMIARQDLSSAQTESLAKTVGDIVNDNGGKMHNTELWGLRTLAYKVNKNRKGHYVLMHFEGEPDTVREVERRMRLHEDILRFITLRLDALPEAPSNENDSDDTQSKRKAGGTK